MFPLPRLAPKEVVSGQPVNYTFSGIANTSNVRLDSFYWRDTLPAQVRLNTVVTGTYNFPGTYKITYRVNGGEYRTLADNLSTAQNYTLAASPTALGRRLGKALHRWHYEDAADPLPEGDISGSGAFSPGQEPALRLTMDHWTPLYLRGYVAGEYTGTGWQQLAAAADRRRPRCLYSLQSGYFFPAQQLAKANGEAESENQ